MVESKKSPAHDAICTTIARYQSTFSANDREGWLALWDDDGVLEDPVGSPPRRGRQQLAAFWDEIHSGESDAHGPGGAGAPPSGGGGEMPPGNEHGHVTMVQGPAVCGVEAAWAFALARPLGDRTLTIEIIDQGTFTEDGRIRNIRAFWSEASIRVS